MATALSFAPLLRQSIGFDRFNDLFETAATESTQKTSFPPYNIVKNGDNNYQITMAVAGFSDKDISITLEKDTLKVAGKIQQQKPKDVEYLYKGIAERSFEQNFRLADHMKVIDAEMAHGILTISLLREAPEASKPQLISIKQRG